VNEFAPANAMVGIADKSAPTRRGDLRPYRRSGFIRETKAGVPSLHRSAVWRQLPVLRVFLLFPGFTCLKTELRHDIMHNVITVITLCIIAYEA